jgi:hypothetical protein
MLETWISGQSGASAADREAQNPDTEKDEPPKRLVGAVPAVNQDCVIARCTNCVTKSALA